MWLEFDINFTHDLLNIKITIIFQCEENKFILLIFLRKELFFYNEYKNYIAKNKKKMINDIVDFLPKYPNINNYVNDVLNPYENFYESIFRKKEFNEFKLEKIEKFPEKTGQLFKHQKLLARFLSSYTLYDQMLLVHDMGTGKTCSAVSVIEQIRKEENNFKGALYLAKGSALINNFIDELIFKCTDGRYIPENFHNLTELEKVHRKKKMVNDFYNWGTFEIFAKEITRSSDDDLIKKYSNHIIIIDEIHNIRIQKKDNDKIKLYKQFWRFLHIVKNCKILLLSGTPMKDGVEEIASVMNLILPENQQLPIQDDFVDDYFDKNEEIYEVKDNMKNSLYSVFKGRVSYLRAMFSDVKRVYEGKTMGTLEHFNVFPDIMGVFQSNNYLKALLLDKEDRKGIYTKSRQASLFVFPDGSFGEEGFKKYIIESGSQNKLVKTKLIGAKKYKLSDDLITQIKADTNEEMLKNLYKFSSKYAQSIRTILQAQQEGKLVFIYNEYVQGSGLILFGKLLELFGFSKATGNEEENLKKPRYASLTNMTATTKQLKSLVDRYNRQDNMHGEIIGVIMGSRKISEGFSLRNVQIEDIHTPWFNYSETSQAIARGIRVGSHNQLLEAGVEVEIRIYQRVSIPDKGESIDLQMYEISEKKDMSIKSVIRLIKEAAWDCSLTYKRNHIEGEDGKRECDYRSCDYECIGVPKELIDSVDEKLDLSTYQLYYSEIIKVVIDELEKIFMTKFSLFYEEIEFMFVDKYTKFEILSSLQKITNENIIFKNKYGFISYLREDCNKYFLIDSLSVKGNYLSEIYTKYPIIIENKTFDEIFEPMYYDILPDIIKKICKTTSSEEISSLLNILPKELLEFILESSLIAQYNDIDKNIDIRVLILKFFDGNYAEIDGVVVSWFLYSDLDTIRCLRDGKFVDCNDFSEKLDEYLISIKRNLEQNPYQVYGQYNKIHDDFCIRDVRHEIPEEGNKIKTGKRCENWLLKDLNLLIITHLNLPIPNDDILNVNERKFLQQIKELSPKRIHNLIKTKIDKDYKLLDIGVEFVELEKENMLRIAFWMKLTKQRKCKILQIWFEQNNLMTQDDQCGKHGKLKK